MNQCLHTILRLNSIASQKFIRRSITSAVAVPAVLGYNWLVRRNKSAMDNVRSFGADLHAVLLSAPKTQTRG